MTGVLVILLAGMLYGVAAQWVGDQWIREMGNTKFQHYLQTLVLGMWQGMLIDFLLLFPILLIPGLVKF